MGFMFRLTFFLCAGLLIFHFLTKKYLNPYKLTMVFGKKGSGKSTLMVRLAYEYLAKGWNVYCTEKLDGCYLIDYKDIGFKQIPPNSVLLIDEVGMIWDNRKFKDFKDEVRDWFKLQRHYKVRVYLFSQTWDIDKKLRDLTDEMYLCTNFMRVWSWAKRIRRKVILTQPMGDSPARIDEELAFDFFFFWPFGARIMTYIPRYAKYFDSHNCPELPHKDFDLVPPEKVPRSIEKMFRKSSRPSKRKQGRKKLILLRLGFGKVFSLFASLFRRRS